MSRSPRVSLPWWRTWQCLSQMTALSRSGPATRSSRIASSMCSLHWIFPPPIPLFDLSLQQHGHILSVVLTPTAPATAFPIVSRRVV